MASGTSRWWGTRAERGDAGRLEAFSDGVLAIAITLLILWRHVVRAGLLVEGVSPIFIRDVDVRYLLGLGSYAAATALAFVSPLLAIVLTVALALMFVLGPSPRPAFPAQARTG